MAAPKRQNTPTAGRETAVGPIFEVVIYRVLADAHQSFSLAHKRLVAVLAQMPGFIELETLPAVGEANLRLDRVAWESWETALSAHRAYRDLPEAEVLARTIAEVVFSGHFQEKL